MEWVNVGKSLLKSAPILGSLLLGPIGGTATSAAVSLISSVLGVEPTPDNVMEAIKDPAKLLELKKIEIENKTKLVKLKMQETTLVLAEETKQIESVNQTMRAEAKSEHWIQYAWRPMWGFASAGTFVAVTLGICILAYKAITTGDGSGLGHIPLIIGAFTSLFSIPAAILGIASWHRGKEKIEGVKKEEMENTGILSKLLDTVK